MSAGLLLVAVMGLLFIAGLVQAFVFAIHNTDNSSQEQTMPATPNRFATITVILRCWLAPTGVMAVFVALSGAANRQWQNFQTTVQPRVPQVVVGQVPLETKRDSGYQIQENNFELNRPKWIADGEKTSGDIKTIVLSSRMWSTEAEAKRELESHAAAIVRADFESRHHGWLDPKGYRCLTEDQISKVAVKDRYIESADQDFGKFSAPMHRIWWQVEISPMVRTELYPSWKSAVAQNRIIVVGTVLALITMFANGLALFASLNRDAGRGVVRSFAICVFGLGIWMSLDLLIAARLLT